MSPILIYATERRRTTTSISFIKRIAYPKQSIPHPQKKKKNEANSNSQDRDDPHPFPPPPSSYPIYSRNLFAYFLFNSVIVSGGGGVSVQID